MLDNPDLLKFVFGRLTLEAIPYLALPLMARLREAGWCVGDNEPYSGELEGDTMSQHGTGRGLPHVLIEIRQDLIADAAGMTDRADSAYSATVKNTAAGGAAPETWIRAAEAYAGFLARHGHKDKALVRFDREGKRVVLAGSFKGNVFNSPNDIAIARDANMFAHAA